MEPASILKVIDVKSSLRKKMACSKCGDLNSLCCANDACTVGECKNGLCSQTRTWGYPCDSNGGCNENLSCNKQLICQNRPTGPPQYGSSCTDAKYCSSQGASLDCVADSVTTSPSGYHFMRCGCATAGSDCTVQSGHKSVCTDQTQNWPPLTAP